MAAEISELKFRLQELEDTLHAIHSGDVDALVVNNAIYTLESAHAATDKLREDVLDQMEDAVFAFDVQGGVMYVNAAAERRYGVSSSDVLGRSMKTVFAETMGLQDPLVSGASAPNEEASVSTHRLPDGTSIQVESVVTPLVGPLGQPFGSLAVIRDVTQRRRTEMRRDALARLTDRLRDAEDAATIGFEAAQILGETLNVSRVGYGTFDAAGEHFTVERDWTAPGVDTVAGVFRPGYFDPFTADLLRGEIIVVNDVRTDQRTRHAPEREARSTRSFLNVPFIEQGKLAAILLVHRAEVRHWSPDELEFVREFSDRTRSVAERARNAQRLQRSEMQLREANETLEATVAARTRELMVAEAALRQSQKMEAVGQLTGGIAHDFNNLLGGVSASLQVLQVRLKQGKHEGIERYIEMGQSSIKRATSLTQRLLAFSRRQTLDPKPIAVNRLTKGLEDLIRRTVGPDVHVEVVAADGLWTTKVDPSQLENALLNLCINARDAMLPRGGRLTIETSNRCLEDLETDPGLQSGQYVSLSVADTGSGMSAEVIEHIFEPFFTTKPLGQGTGLGLSMVYGFVKQSGGQVRVMSEGGEGTTICLYLPRYLGSDAVEEERLDRESTENGDGETVLVIEDEEIIRLLVAEVLQDTGFKVMTASDGPAGLRILESTRRIDLLVTDVGLPGGLNGRQVADAARRNRPRLKVLFITGYAENAAVGNGLLEAGMEVLTKPFEITALAKKVSAMVNGH